MENKCNLCEKSFRHPWHVRRHINATHNKIKPVSCDDCGKSFDSKRYLIKYHKCKGAHQCKLCKKIYPNKRLLKLHKTNCGKPNDIIKPKDESAELSQNPDDGHSKKLTGISCDVCGKSFIKKSKMIIHKCRNQKCECCDKYFTNNVIHRHMEKCCKNPAKQHFNQEKLKTWS